jgi:hypothetical protein
MENLVEIKLRDNINEKNYKDNIFYILLSSKYLYFDYEYIYYVRFNKINDCLEKKEVGKIKRNIFLKCDVKNNDLCFKFCREFNDELKTIKKFSWFGESIEIWKYQFYEYKNLIITDDNKLTIEFGNYPDKYNESFGYGYSFEIISNDKYKSDFMEIMCL